MRTSELPEDTCGMSSYYPDAGIGEIDVLRVDGYEKRPGCLDGRRHPARPAKQGDPRSAARGDERSADLVRFQIRDRDEGPPVFSCTCRGWLEMEEIIARLLRL